MSETLDPDFEKWSRLVGKYVDVSEELHDEYREIARFRFKSRLPADEVTPKKRLILQIITAKKLLALICRADKAANNKQMNEEQQKAEIEELRRLMESHNIEYTPGGSLTDIHRNLVEAIASEKWGKTVSS